MYLHVLLLIFTIKKYYLRNEFHFSDVHKAMNHSGSHAQGIHPEGVHVQ